MWKDDKIREKIMRTLSKPINQYSRDGKYLATYSSILEATKQIEAGKGNIGNCCKYPTHHKTCGGFQWRFYEGNTEDITPVGIRKRAGESVNQYSQDGKYISTFLSLSEAARHIRVHVSSIYSCCNFITKTCGGFQWRFYEGNTNNIEPVSSDPFDYITKYFLYLCKRDIQKCEIIVKKMQDMIQAEKLQSNDN